MRTAFKNRDDFQSIPMISNQKIKIIYEKRATSRRKAEGARRNADAGIRERQKMSSPQSAWFPGKQGRSATLSTSGGSKPVKPGQTNGCRYTGRAGAAACPVTGQSRGPQEGRAGLGRLPAHGCFPNVLTLSQTQSNRVKALPDGYWGKKLRMTKSMRMTRPAPSGTTARQGKIGSRVKVSQTQSNHFPGLSGRVESRFYHGQPNENK
jgi:hypothetical protein